MKKLLFILTSLFAATIVSAQKYHDAAAFGLNGHVKECIVDSSSVDPYGFKYVSFNKDGCLDSLDYNGGYITHINRSNGYITDYVEEDFILLFFGYVKHKKTFQYKNNRLFRTLFYYNEEDKTPNVTTYKYGEKGLNYREEGVINISDIKEEIDRGNYIFDFFSIESKYDIYGTWYNVKNMDKYGNYTTIDIYRYNLEKEDFEYQKTINRRISYWDDSSSSGNSTSFSTNMPAPPNSTPKTPTTVSSPTTKQTFTAKGVSFTMVRVEGGTFKMGATPEQGSSNQSMELPTHQVTLSSYYIGVTEVTQELWEAVMGTTVSQQRDKADKSRSLRGEGKNYPMYYVSWDDCQEFIQKLNAVTGKKFRLPTEAEWEFAARGGNKSQGYKYSGSDDIEEIAWYWINSGDQKLSDDYDNQKIKANNCCTHPVAKKTPNELGLYDMSGNVFEWCNDWYGSYNSSSQKNPKGAKTGQYRVIRGGSWAGVPQLCQTSFRNGREHDSFSSDRGFRLALSE